MAMIKAEILAISYKVMSQPTFKTKIFRSRELDELFPFYGVEFSAARRLALLGLKPNEDSHSANLKRM